MSIAERIAALPRPLLFALDVDGTLAPITVDPADARVPEATQALLRRIAQADGVILALITGRDADALARMARLPEAWRAVEHGGRILAPGTDPGASVLTDTERDRLAQFAAWVERDAIPRGAKIERKARAVVVHTRALEAQDPVAGTDILAQAEQNATAWGLLPRRGRSVLEAELERGDKGVALRELMTRTQARSAFFAGDDLTDLPAIQLASTHGIGLFVTSKERPSAPSEATESVDGPESIAILLSDLASIL